tara:strand:+ start:623 stop:1141 length:519 start_codon:yes stop_codon:yes gene_type:complete
MTIIEKLNIIQNKKYHDKRGYFQELLKEKQINKKFPFIVMSYSKKNVLRGLHIQTNKSQGKYVSVLKGKIFDVVVDLRKKSKSFGKCYKNILSEKNSRSLYIPPGFAHGFVGIDNNNYVIYSCTNYRDKNSEIGIKYNDPTLKIKWPKRKFIISSKDKQNISFKEFKDKYIK